MLKFRHIAIEGLVSFLETVFAVSELSGSIGIASTLAKPTLSVIYPGTNKPHLILSKDDQYRSALFRTISGEEYLAVVSMEDIRLYNVANSTSKVVYKSEQSRHCRLCVIDERTVASVGERPTYSFINIQILKTDAEMWTLSSTLFVKATDSVSDISSAKTSDSTACFLLNFRFSNLTQCVEMVGGRVRWQVDKLKMGRFFHPRSICTDGNTILAADPLSAVLHLLSVDDGSVLTSIGLRPFGIRLPGCVLAQGEYLYIGHKNEKSDTYCISKFTKPTEV